MSSPLSNPTIERSVFVASDEGVCVMAASFYTEAEGSIMQSLHWQLTRSDTVDIAFSRTSTDNGATWSEPETIVTREDRPDGVLRRFLLPGYVDPATGRLLIIRLQAVLPGDSPKHDGPKNWLVRYAVSADGGQTEYAAGQAIQDGEEFTALHPFPGQWVGRNSIAIGALTCTPLTLPDGSILIPCTITPMGEDGEYVNHGGGYTFTDVLMIKVTWKDDGTPGWKALPPLKGDPERTTRGLVEPTIWLLDDGRVLMVMRGSNDVKLELPGTKWMAISADGGVNWTEPVPWTFEDGETFYSPSSCSQLLAHSSGELLWFGNLVPNNPKGNWPRYPLVMGRVNKQTGLLKRETVTVIDDRAEGESEKLQLSNFFVREDRESGDIILHCSRMFVNQELDKPLDWTADALQYRIAFEG